MNPKHEKTQPRPVTIEDLETPTVSFEQIMSILNPADDPFGMNYEYLKDSSIPQKAAIQKFAIKQMNDLKSVISARLRDVTAAEALGSLTDDVFLKRWIVENYPRMCVAAGEDGELNFRLLKSHGILMETFISDALEVLEQQPEITGLSLEEKAVLAYVVVEHYRPKKRKKEN